MLKTKQRYYAKPDPLYLDDIKKESSYEDPLKKDRVIRIKSKINDVLPEKPNQIDRKNSSLTMIVGPKKKSELNRFSTFYLAFKTKYKDDKIPNRDGKASAGRAV